MNRGQTLVFFALTMLLVVVMACMTLSISNRVRQKLELQTVADAAAYNNAVSTARGLNSMGVINRTIVSHWVVMLSIDANIAWGSTVPAYFDSFADTLNDMRFSGACADGPTGPNETRRQKELLAARDAFNHASLSVWSGEGSGSDAQLLGCPRGNCFPPLRPGLGQLDKAAAQQSKEVWRSARDLVEVQRDLHAELQEVLEQQTLATQATLAAQGKPLDALQTFPYQVHRGAPARTILGLPGRPPGWREVSSAFGTTREALTPLAHAAMGSRGSRFVISNKYQRDHAFFPFTPRRAKLYAQRIERLMNSRYGVAGRAPFEFKVRGKQSSTFLDDGQSRDDPANADIDELYEYLAERDPGVAEDESSAEAADAPTQYDPNSAARITPWRSIGFEYVTAQENGTISVLHRSPCGKRTWERGLTSAARSHTQMGVPAVSQHEWRQVSRSSLRRATALDAPDGTRDYVTVGRGILHGDGRSDGHGYEQPGHGPSGQCHPGHRHWGEADDSIHTLGREIDGLGLSPGGFGFVFPQNGRDPVTRLDRDGAAGAFGQPKLPVLLTRATTGPGLVPDPWNLSFRFSLVNGGSGQRIDLAKRGNPTPLAALATGIAYYHRRCDRYQPQVRADPDGTRASCASWNEAPNLLNPFWRATLVPIDIDETLGGPDRTPGNRLVDEAPAMLDSAGLGDAALTYRLLKSRGFEGIQ